jgi:hypothetical protein
VTRPQPVITAASVTSTIKAVVSVLALLGFNEASLHLSAMTTSIVAVVIGVYELAPHILVALHVRSQVTPIADPKTGTGEPLVPVSAVGVCAATKGGRRAAVDRHRRHADPARPRARGRRRQRGHLDRSRR